MERGYKSLQVYQIAHELAIKVHEMSLNLPSFERYEEGSQIRRSAKSASANIVEGYALRKYRNEYLHYLYRAYGSAEETIEHLELLFRTKSLQDEKLFRVLYDDSQLLCGKMMRLIQAVEKEHETPNFLKEPELEYRLSLRKHPARRKSQISNH